ncbi:MAG: hypothetical protein AAGC99_14980 [Pseudomonadota bacterium]
MDDSSLTPSGRERSDALSGWFLVFVQIAILAYAFVGAIFLALAGFVKLEHFQGKSIQPAPPPDHP